MNIIKIFNTKAKPLTVFIFSVSFLGIFILSSLLATGICQKWYGLVIGLVMMLIAIPFHCKGKNTHWCYLISFIINSIASGFIVSAYYLEKEIVLNIYNLIISAIPAAAITFLVYLILQCFRKSKRTTITVAAIINTVLTITAMVLWIKYSSVIFSFGFFCSLISFFYLCVFGITVNHDERSVFRDISFGSFGSLIIIAVVVIFILSEGEFLEGFDFGGEGGKKSKKK